MKLRGSGWFCVAIVLLCAWLIYAPSAQAEPSVTLVWNAPTTNADGTPLDDLAGYRVYMAYQPIDEGSDPQRIADVPADQLTTQVDVGPLPSPGAVVYFRATAYDTSGNESAYSNEVSQDFMPPTTIIIRFQ